LARKQLVIERLTEATYSTGLSAAVFLLFVVFGCAYIIVAKLAGVDQFYVTFVPVGIMLGYALMIVLARNLRLRDDQSGDNLYYMGFLFTLTSLGVSLYQFSATRAAEEIVQNFGIAIGSTIAGVGLRVVFNQMRRDPVEIERIMRLELAEAARRVRRELDSTVVEFGYHRRTAQQAAADSFRQIAERFDEIVGKFDATLREVTDKLAQPLESASRHSGDTLAELSKTLTTTLGASAQQLGTETDRLSIRVNATSIALDDAIAKLRAVETPGNVIRAGLEPVAATMTQAVERFSEQSTGTMTAVTQSLEATSNAMIAMMEEFKSDSRVQVEQLRALLQKTDETMRTFTDILIKSTMEAAVQSDGLREAVQATEAGAQMLAMAAEKISQSVEAARFRYPTSHRERVD
jgi:hypothetical protein